MKRFIVLCLFSWVCSYIFAYDFIVDGIAYNYNKTFPNQVSVTWDTQDDKYLRFHAKDVVIPETVVNNNLEYVVTGIDDEAFSRARIKSVTLPKSLKYIGKESFYAAIFTTISLPEGLTSIGSGAFGLCYYLKSITFPQSLNSIGNDAFTQTEWYNSHPDGIVYAGKVVYKYKGEMKEDTKIHIPEGITGIGEYAFRDCSGLTSITLPNSVQHVGRGAFSGCSSLINVVLPEGLTRIEDETFKYCYRLTPITLPESLTSIGSQAFDGCDMITSITIPKNISDIASDAFEGCDWIESISVAPENEVYDSRNNCNALIETVSNTIIRGCKNTIIPEGVTTIGANAFWECRDLTSIQIPESIKKINDSAFANCYDLESFHIPKNIESIGHGILACCSSLTSLSVDKDNQFYDSREDCNAIVETATNTLICGCRNTVIPTGITSIGNYAFQRCHGLKSINLECVTTIGNHAFSGCIGLTSVAIPESVTSIGDYAFSGCENLTSIALPKEMVTIGSNAFAYCSQLQTIIFPTSVTSIGKDVFAKTLWYESLPDGVVYLSNWAYAYKGQMSKETDIVLKEGTSGIANNIFQNCYLLRSIILPEGLSVIENNAFENCTSLTTVNFPESLTKIGEHAFYNCSSITEAIISDHVQSIGDWAFANCKKLTSVRIPATQKRIGNYMFYNCSSILELSIPESVTVIGTAAFYGCSSLKELHFPQSITTLENSAFANCTSLKKIIIPSQMKNMERQALWGLKIDSLIVECTQPPTIYQRGYISGAADYSSTFSPSTQRHSILFVPQGTKAEYLQASGWDMFCRITDDDDPEVVSFTVDNMNYHVFSIKNQEVELVRAEPAYEGDVVIPPTVTHNGITYTVTRIANGTFDSKSLTSIRIPKTVNEIQADLANHSICNIYIEDLSAWCAINFTNNNGELREPGYWTGIYEYKINNNLYLYVNEELVTELKIPDGVTVVNDASFAGFKGFKTVTFPASVKRIGHYAFCESELESVIIPATIEQIGRAAFSDCELLTSLTIENGIQEIGPESFAGCPGLKELSIPASVKRLHNFAFAGCTNLKALALTTGLERIGEWTFAFCAKLTEVALPSGLKSIGRNAFTSCKGLKSISIPEGLERIDRYAFNRCVALSSLHIPASVSYVGRNVVEECQSLKSLTVAADNKRYDTRNNGNAIFETATNTIVAAAAEAPIPSGTEYLGDYAFAYCSDRQHFALPEGIRRIGVNAFLHCWSLHSITIPESVDSIGYAAFDICEGLTDIIALPNRPCAIHERTFPFSRYEQAILYVPDDAIDAYRQAEGWKYFKHIKGLSTIPDGIENDLERTSDDIKIKVEGNRVLLSGLAGRESVHVYRLDGSLVKMIQAAPDGCAIVVLPPRGFYVIHTATKSVKVKI